MFAQPTFHLKKGDTAPNFTAPNQHEKHVSLADYKGKKLVVYFYPQDDTPTCTTEACNLRDNQDRLLNSGYTVLGISPDAPKKHQKFIAKYSLPFDLIADEDTAIAKAFGVWGYKKFMGKEYEGLHRTTFLIDENGKIEDIITDVKSKIHTDQILGAGA